MTSTQDLIWTRPDWPQWRYDSARVAPKISAARRAQGVVEGKITAIGLPNRQEIIAEAWSQEAMATAAIEGDRLNIDAVRSSIARRLGTLSANMVRATRHVEGLLDVMDDAVLNANAPLTDDRLQRWQSALFPHGKSGLNDVQVGAYRSHEEPMRIVSGRVGNEIVHYEAPPSHSIAREMTLFLDSINRPDSVDNSVDNIVKAAIAHLWFETLHPFEDGNGRVGRALIDLILARDAGETGRLFRISQRLLDVQGEYYAQLARAQHGDLDITEWIIWFVEQFHIACISAAAIIDLSLEKGRFWANHTDQSLTERQRKVINLLLDAGPGGFEGGMSTKKYQSIARTSRATASRELLSLQKNSLLAVSGAGPGTRYHIALPGWAPQAAANNE
jgi:Fic family protein